MKSADDLIILLVENFTDNGGSNAKSQQSGASNSGDEGDANTKDKKKKKKKGKTGIKTYNFHNIKIPEWWNFMAQAIFFILLLSSIRIIFFSMSFKQYYNGKKAAHN